jgi:hypothetical protein
LNAKVDWLGDNSLGRLEGLVSNRRERGGDVSSCSPTSFRSCKIVVEFSIRFKFFCCWLIGGRDIGPIVIKVRAIVGIRGYIVTVKILTARLGVVIVIKT